MTGVAETHVAAARGEQARAPASVSLASAPPAVQEAAATAREAGLTYVTDARPGIRRERVKDGFRYVDRDGKLVRDEAALERIRALAIPPAWEDVWICPTANGHLQATGWDARGRKQYRYHARWRSVRDETKFGRLVDFARALPGIRRRVAADLRLPGLPREKVLAAVVRLLETTFIRVGNERYAKENGSFGLTTMRNRHVRVRGEHIEFEFRGKSGVQHRIGLKDAQLARIIRQCRDLPGYELFEYVDAEGEVRSIESSDVNEYLKAISGEDYTAKDFRTWAGTVLAALVLCRTECPRNDSHAKSVLKNAIAQVAHQLGNTVAVARKCYIHPRVVETFMQGVGEDKLPDPLAAIASLPATRRNVVERAVVRLLTAKLRPRRAPTLTQALKASVRAARTTSREGRADRMRRRVATARRVERGARNARA
ncbi:MAG TPA: DNA topoisomerase IB [Casimicrobiaceae bacterium]|nr:DNA topoisomerase IB [Casimicrobiaceae bacterium]